VSLRLRILRVVYTSSQALTVREVCCVVNGRSFDFCRNIDGRGSRCFYCYKSDHDLTYKLVEPKCRWSYKEVLHTVKALEREGKLKTRKTKLPDKLSPWGKDYFVLVYVRPSQLEARLRRNNKALTDFLT